MLAEPKPCLEEANEMSKKRTFIISLVAAFSVAGLAAVPASARRTICTQTSSGVLECHRAKNCIVRIREPNGDITEKEYYDGETEKVSGKNMKCDDGKWVPRSSREGSRTEGGPPPLAPETGSSPPSNSTKPSGSPPPAK
jgi:hypothetical protein